MIQNFSLKTADTIARTTLGITAVLSLSSCNTVIPASAATTITSSDEPVIALVLGGGGAKGLAHVGVIKTLENNDIHPNLVVGSSIGSVIGSLYASGMPAHTLEQLALTTPDSAILDYTLSYQGVIEGSKLRQFVNTQVDNRPIEALPIRFAAVATEKNTYQKTVFTTGETGLVVQASSSVPNLFIAPRIPDQVGKKYIDGGMSSMVPVDTARDLGADVVIAVDVMGDQRSYDSKEGDNSHGNNIWSLIDYHFSKEGKYSQAPSSRALTALSSEADSADVVIRPDVSSIRTFDTTLRQQTIDAGVVATEAQLLEIKQAISEITEP